MFSCYFSIYNPLHWRHNGHDSVSNDQSHNCLLNQLFRHRSRKISNLASLAFVRGIHRRPVNSPHKWPVTRKIFPFDDVFMVKTTMWHQIQQRHHRLTSVTSSHWVWCCINRCVIPPSSVKTVATFQKMISRDYNKTEENKWIFYS